jgi:hypothetical protein
MSISGSLEDVSVADVMQFIHLGRRTGTLVLERGDDRALIGFHNGRLISARGRGQARVGDLLVDRGLIDPETLARAVACQRDGERHRTLGQILVGGGDLSPQELRKVIVEQIERTIPEVVLWDRGKFDFAVDDLRPVDDIALYLGDVLPEADIDTQMILLQAARILDERNRVRTDLPTEGPAPSPGSPEGEAPDPGGAALPDGPAELRTGYPEVVLVSADDRLAAGLADAGLRVRRVGLETAGTEAKGGEQRVVAVDLRQPGVGLASLEQLCRADPRLAVVAIVAAGTSFAAAYRAGAAAVLPPDVDSVAACVPNLAAGSWTGPPLHGGLSGRSDQAMARLRRVFGDLRSGLLSATMALNLMHTVSESAERAVLFLVRRSSLLALGAFGAAADGWSLADRARNLRLTLGEPNALSFCVSERQARSFAFEEAALPEPFAAILGRPHSGQVVIFPILGAQRVIALIYADNGDRLAAIEDIEILELATAQVGLAFENELLRREIAHAAG